MALRRGADLYLLTGPRHWSIVPHAVPRKWFDVCEYSDEMTEPIVLANSEKWTISSHSDVPGVRVMLAHPSGGVQGEVPVLVLLDGDFLFLSATEFVRTLNLVTMGDFPPVAVVGIMRDETDPIRYIASRFRDFTPHEWTLTGPFADDNSMASMGTGGAGPFLRTIEHDVLPQVRERLGAIGVTIGDVAIGGWSLSGLFASWAWMHRPDLFAHLLSISPSLWWSDRALLSEPFVLRSAHNKVFVCSGEHEEGDMVHVYPQRFAHAEQRDMAAMVRNAETFGRLVADTGATVDSITVQGEHHVTVQSAAIARGLRHIFG